MRDVSYEDFRAICDFFGSYRGCNESTYGRFKKDMEESGVIKPDISREDFCSVVKYFEGENADLNEYSHDHFMDYIQLMRDKKIPPAPAPPEEPESYHTLKDQCNTLKMKCLKTILEAISSEVDEGVIRDLSRSAKDLSEVQP